MNNNNSESGKKTAAITSYILGIGVYSNVYELRRQNAFASFHIRQGLGLTLTFISLGLIISNFDSLMISAPMWIFVLFYGLMALLAQ
jgi:hypothetical protein